VLSARVTTTGEAETSWQRADASMPICAGATSRVISITVMSGSLTTLRKITALVVVAALFLSSPIPARGGVQKPPTDDRPITTLVFHDRPRVFTRKSLAIFLSQNLSPEDVKLVKNPLDSTPEMDDWARKVTAGKASDIEKAKTLFDELLRHPSGSGLAGDAMSAQEAFDAWKAGNAPLYCEDWANLYVALGRAAGLQTFLVEVTKQYDGATPRHACAAVLVGDDAVLVDLSIPWFGVPHQTTTILDDLEALASFEAQRPGLAAHRIAYKLAPELSGVESNYYLSLANKGQWDEARKVLNTMPQWHTEAWVTNFAEGRWAMHEGNLNAAETFLRQTIRLNSYVGVCRRMLGDVLFQEGKLDEARAVFEESLRYLFDDFDVSCVHDSISQIDAQLRDRAATNARPRSVTGK
jgi:hypothetical protein